MFENIGKSTGMTSNLVTRIGSSLLILAGLLVAMMWFISPREARADPQTYYISTNGDNAQDCMSVSTACRSLQVAIPKAVAGDIILVAQGFYTDSMGTVALITDSITLQGGWNDAFTECDPVLYPTTLDAQQSGSVIILRGFDISNVITPTIEGFIITGGNGTDMADCPVSPTGGCGGGIMGTYAIPQILNNVITNNIASTLGIGYGGGIYLQGVATGGIISGNHIIHNLAVISSTEVVTGYGGGISLLDVTTTLQNNVISENIAAIGTGYGGGVSLIHSGSWIYTNTLHGNTAGAASISTSSSLGGGIYIWRSGATYSSVPTIEANELRENVGCIEGQGAGGGVALQNTEVVIIDNQIISNTSSLTSTQQGDGGAIYGRHGDSWIISRNRLLNNTSSTGGRGFGGAMQLEYGHITVEDNLISGNIASKATVDVTARGGGVNLLACTGVMRHNVVSDNAVAVDVIVAGYGGGISVVDVPVELDRNTIVDNEATRWGGGIRIYMASPVTITNNIIANNSAFGQGGGIHVFGGSEGIASALLIHNTLAENTQGVAGEGVYVNGHSTVTMTNNIVVSHTNGIYNAGTSPTTTVIADYSLFYGNTVDIVGSVSSTNAVYGSPAFVDPAGDDYHIHSNSSAVNTGTNTWVLIDIDGELRPQDLIADIGADEYISCTTPTTYYLDADEDGYGDAASSIISCSLPAGYVESDEDCDDTNADINPGADEVCNGIDDDCDGDIDDDDPSCSGQPTWYLDADEDGYGDPTNSLAACTQPPGYVADNSDCDDSNENINPGADEICNTIDDDCDGDIDDDDPSCTGQTTWYRDADLDGYGDSANSLVACIQPAGYVGDAGDCDDNNGNINPGASEICNGIDDDCDGDIDDDDPSCTGQPTWYRDADEDGYGDPANSLGACTQPTGYVADNGDCDDSNGNINPDASEICNGIDDDCNGDTDDGIICTGAGDWYVDVSCTTCGTGTIDSPFQTINQALTVISDGDTILVAQGIYTENLVIDVPVTVMGGYSATLPMWTRAITQYETIITSADRTITGDWNGDSLGASSVIKDGSMYRMWYSGGNDVNGGTIGYAESPDGVNWNHPYNTPLLETGTDGMWDQAAVSQPSVLLTSNGYRMWYLGQDTLGHTAIGYATSSDGLTWGKYLSNPVLSPDVLDGTMFGSPIVIQEAPDRYIMRYSGGRNIWLATSPDGINWTKDLSSPVLTPGVAGSWDDDLVYAPYVITGLTGYEMWYVGEDNATSIPRIGYAWSDDGINWTKSLFNPVLTGTLGSWDEGGNSYPAVIKETDYKMWYLGGVNSPQAYGHATSSDGAGWTKYGLNPIINQGNPTQWGSSVVWLRENSNDSVLDGLTITGGFSRDGGGISLEGLSPTIRNCTVQDNIAYLRGGGMEILSGSPMIENTVVRSNEAMLGWGAGVYVSDATLTITSSLFIDNVAILGGGGLAIWRASTTTIHNSLVTQNTGDRGGGIDLDGESTLSIHNSRIDSNVADSVSGIHVRASTLAMTNTFIVDNNNVADSDGSLGLFNSSGRLVNVTIANNNASSGAAGIYFYTSNPADELVLLNSILAYNGTDDLNCLGGTCMVTYSDLLEGYSGVGNISVLPQFVNREQGDYHLRSNSFCIDAGTGDGAPETDFEGDFRPGDAVDMGADEFTGEPVEDTLVFLPLIIRNLDSQRNFSLYLPLIVFDE